MKQNILPHMDHDNAIMNAEEVRMTFDEIANKLGVSRKLVSNAFYSGLNKLRGNKEAICLLRQARK
jgi:hypothetical protein